MYDLSLSVWHLLIAQKKTVCDIPQFPLSNVTRFTKLVSDI